MGMSIAQLLGSLSSAGLAAVATDLYDTAENIFDDLEDYSPAELYDTIEMLERVCALGVNAAGGYIEFGAMFSYGPECNGTPLIVGGAEIAGLIGVDAPVLDALRSVAFA